MPSVAIIGPDGAGKTTLTRMLEESGTLPFKYLYMGVDISASNLALPTSRIAGRFGSEQKRSNGPGGDARPPRVPPRSVRRRGPMALLWGMARLANRIAEEWFRQLASWYYQFRGYVVLYDRHFAFDFAPEFATGPEPLDQRIHRWFLAHLYPRPDLVLFLDVPGEILFSRKGESFPAELERRRQAFLQIGRRCPSFVRIDATQPLPKVYAEVSRCVVKFCQPERSGLPVQKAVP
jgi:thymidylate kinase